MKDSASSGQSHAFPAQRSRGEIHYLATSQVARRWSVSAVTVHRLIGQGDLRGLKIGGVYRISKRSIEEYEQRVAF